MFYEMIKEALDYLDKFDMDDPDCADVKAVYEILKIIPIQIHEEKKNLFLIKIKEMFL